MLIYENQNILDYHEFVLGLVLLFFGIITILFSSKFKPILEQDFTTRFFNLTQEDLNNRAQVFPRLVKFMGAILIIAGGSLLFSPIKTFIYINGISLFEDVKTTSGKVESVSETEMFGLKFITVNMGDVSFELKKDRRYIYDKDLIRGDSILVEYFENENDEIVGKPIVKEVLKIELQPVG